MSAPDEVAQMVERLKAERENSDHAYAIAVLFGDAAALLERLQRENAGHLVALAAWTEECRLDAEIIHTVRAEASEARLERDALRARLEAAEAALKRIVTMYGPLADCSKLAWRALGMTFQEAEALHRAHRDTENARVEAEIAQRPAAEEQGT